MIAADEGAIEIATEEVFGNCPKYIQSRVPAGRHRAPPDRPGPPRPRAHRAAAAGRRERRHALHRERPRGDGRGRVAPRRTAGLRARPGRADAARSRLRREQHVPDPRQSRGRPARGTALRGLRHGHDAAGHRAGRASCGIARTSPRSRAPSAPSRSGSTRSSRRRATDRSAGASASTPPSIRASHRGGLDGPPPPTLRPADRRARRWPVLGWPRFRDFNRGEGARHVSPGHRRHRLHRPAAHPAARGARRRRRLHGCEPLRRVLVRRGAPGAGDPRRRHAVRGRDAHRARRQAGSAHQSGVRARGGRGQSAPGHAPRHPRHGQLLRGRAPGRRQAGGVRELDRGERSAEPLRRPACQRGRSDPRRRPVRHAQDLQRVPGAEVRHQLRHVDHGRAPRQRHRARQAPRLDGSRADHDGIRTREAGAPSEEGR